jgi:hypothetical protein
MNRCFGFYLVGLIGLMCCRGMAEVTAVPADPGISDTSKSDLSLATNSAEIEEITQKVQAEVTKLSQNQSDPATVTMIRQWLIGEMQSKNNPGGTSPAYQEAYAAALNSAFMDALVQPSTPVNTRLNIGIVIKLLPGRTEKLAPSVVQLLKDKSPAVVLWGERAAAAILPAGVQDAAFNAGPRDDILAAIVNSVAAHADGPLSGMIADEANQAINPKLNVWPQGRPPTPAVLSVLIDASLKLQKARLEIYRKTGVPGAPIADTYATYLTMGTADVWNLLTPAQQLQAAQQASDFVSWASERAVGRQNNQNDDLIQALKEEGRWIMELGKTLNDQAITAAGSGVNDLGVAAQAQQVRDACSMVLPALQGNQALSGVQAAAPIEGAKSPADASATPAASEAQQ